MKKLITLGLLMILAGLILSKQDEILTIINTYIAPNKTVELGEKNEYYRDYDFNYVQNTNNFSPNNMQDILNIYYTVLNAGKDQFSFYCPKEYTNCLNDIQTLAKDQDQLSDINNYVHPYNSFSHIETEYDSLGKITIKTNKTYSAEDIALINSEIDELAPKLIDKNKSLTDNIRTIHDYIINNTKYDSDRSDSNIINYRSDMAYGPLFEGYAICGGYTDLMELFLERMDVESFKISSEKHVWNAVYVNNTWKHLDLTWDDPVASDHNNYLEHKYFLIDTKTLLQQEPTQHNYNQDVYSELK